MYGCTLVQPPALPDRSSSLPGTRDISCRPDLAADVAVNRLAADPSRRPYYNAPVYRSHCGTSRKRGSS